MDMRGHGFTQVDGPKKGYNVETLADDIGRLADHLGIDQFHLLTHATGGIAAFRFAMSNGNRVLSMMATDTDTGSATYPIDEYCEITDPQYEFPELSEIDKKRNRALSKNFRNGQWGEIINGTRATAKHNPFLTRLPVLSNQEQAFATYFACSSIGNPDNFADFIDEFYTSYDPQISGLRSITCPTLMLLGEHDRMFIKPAELIAREVANCTHVVMPGVGHMTAIEDPPALCQHLLDFLA